MHLYLRWEFCFMNHSWTDGFNLCFRFEWGKRYIDEGEVKCFNAIVGGEGP